MLKRIKYVSRYNHALSQANIDALAERAKVANEERDVTGVLMTAGGLFLQVIEGPTEQIDDLYDRIRRDHRHRDVLLLSAEEDVPGRLFPEWSMRRIALDESADARFEPLKILLEAIVEQRETLDKLTNALERSVWQELSSAGGSRSPAAPTSEPPSA